MDICHTDVSMPQNAINVRLASIESASLFVKLVWVQNESRKALGVYVEDLRSGAPHTSCRSVYVESMEVL